MRARGAPSLIATLLALGLCLALPARAQLAASVSVDSDYRFRGVTLSDNKPAARLNLSYDNMSGAYAGLSAFAAEKTGYVGAIAYAGYVWRPLTGPALEAGASYTQIREHYPYTYAEIYTGIITRALTARLYYSPDYFGGHTHTLYADLNSGRQLSPHWRAFVHGGMLNPLSSPVRRPRYDVRAGVAVSISHYELQLAWSHTSPNRAYAWHPADDGDAVIATATSYF